IETNTSLVTVMISNQLGATDTTEHKVELNGKTYSWTGFCSLEENLIDSTSAGQEK
ncbi:hypothetical protein, partial [Vibrio sp. D173a]|uniref:hypothetical protein n=1 Tax=Vibrio sp. D173a TaxID=2836349 RepID=UPI0035C6C534